MALSNRVREYRQRRRLGLRELARSTRIDPGHLSRLEAGSKGASDEVKLRLADYFGVSVDALFFQASVENNPTRVPA